MTDDLYPDLPYGAQEALWLIDGGTPVAEACRRAGVLPATLSRGLYAAGITRPSVTATCQQLRTEREKEMQP